MLDEINSVNILQNNYPHSYNTRNRQFITQTNHNLELFKKKTTYMGKRFLGLLPKNIKNENNIRLFKKELKQFLISNPFYSLKEFTEKLN